MHRSSFFFVLGWLAVACKEDESACASTSDCPAERICVDFGQGDEGTCAIPCDDQLGCPTRMTCVEGGNSCAGCEDITYVCVERTAPS